MKILVVDDSYEKVEIIASGIVSAGLSNKCVSHCSNSSDALIKMVEERFDILFLDLQLPSSLGEPIEEDGGVNLLELVTLNPSVNKPIHIIAITSHEESYNRYKNYFNERGWIILSSDLSKEIIKSIVIERITTKSDIKKVDVAILTALEFPELQSVLDFPINWDVVMFEGDPTIYHLADITISSGETKCIMAVTSPRMGLVSASSLTTKIQINFNPRFIFMAGICAGVKEKTNLGDIIVGDPVWDWGSGKSTRISGVPTHLPSPHQVSLDTRLRSKLMRLSVENKYLDEIFCSFKAGSRPHHDLKLIIGPMASGASVIEDEDIVERIKSTQRDVVSVEMEAYGVMASVQITSENPAKVIIIKSVCDHANLKKDNEWQKYAAYTSSQYVFKLIINEIF